MCVCVQYAEEGRACLGWPTRSIYRGETGTPAPPHSRRLGGHTSRSRHNTSPELPTTLYSCIALTPFVATPISLSTTPSFTSTEREYYARRHGILYRRRQPLYICVYYIYHHHHHSSRARVIRPAQGCHSTCSSLLSNELPYIYKLLCFSMSLNAPSPSPLRPRDQDLHLPLRHSSYLHTYYIPLYPTILCIEPPSFCSTPSPHSKPFPLCHCLHLTISFLVYTHPIIGSTLLPPSPSSLSHLRVRTWQLRAANFQLLFVFRFYDDILFYFPPRSFLSISSPFHPCFFRSPFRPPSSITYIVIKRRCTSTILYLSVEEVRENKEKKMKKK